MSRKKREAMEQDLNGISKDAEIDKNVKKQSFWKSLQKGQKFLVMGIIAFAALGVFGSTMKYLEESARQEAEIAKTRGYLNELPENQPSLLSRLNPFSTSPTPNPTPQLSKEYIYAGSRMLAVEDANTTNAPLADLAIWRPSNGLWCVLGGPGSQQTIFQWGQTGDQPAQGDYDGDGKTDFAVFRPSSSTFWIFKSSDNTYYSIPFGMAGDQIVQSDYDGDGRTDVAVFRPSNAAWYWLNSGSNYSFSYLYFGLSTDKPSPADYDGDGKTDVGVWRSSNNTFYSNNSSNNQLSSATFAVSSNEPVSADYDGDGRADYAIRNGNNWLIRQSSNNQTTTTAWQNAADIATQNDFDGDGKTDIAVWRNSDGMWLIRQSGSNNSLSQAQWGMAGDIPVSAYYRR